MLPPFVLHFHFSPPPPLFLSYLVHFFSVHSYLFSLSHFFPFSLLSSLFSLFFSRFFFFFFSFSPSLLSLLLPCESFVLSFSSSYSSLTPSCSRSECLGFTVAPVAASLMPVPLDAYGFCIRSGGARRSQNVYLRPGTLVSSGARSQFRVPGDCDGGGRAQHGRKRNERIQPHPLRLRADI